MSVVPDSERLEGLRQLGLSPALICQALGEQLHPYFWYRCLGPSGLLAQAAAVPEGSLVYPLWDCEDAITAAWQPGGKLQLIEFNRAAPQEFVVLARSEQGLWARIFDQLHEDYITLQREDFVVPSKIVGFRFLDTIWDEYERTRHKTFEQHQAFIDTVVAQIDALTFRGA